MYFGWCPGLYLVSGRTLTQLFDRLADKLYVLTGTALHVGRHEILSIIMNWKLVMSGFCTERKI